MSREPDILAASLKGIQQWARERAIPVLDGTLEVDGLPTIAYDLPSERGFSPHGWKEFLPACEVLRPKLMALEVWRGDRPDWDQAVEELSAIPESDEREERLAELEGRRDEADGNIGYLAIRVLCGEPACLAEHTLITDWFPLVSAPLDGLVDDDDSDEGEEYEDEDGGESPSGTA